jgi:hypothetical protein
MLKTSVWGASGRWFESSHPDNNQKAYKQPDNYKARWCDFAPLAFFV